MASALQGRRILIVEDEYFIAADLKRTLARQGAEVVGPVGSVAGGLTLAEEPLDAAVLDVNLGAVMSFPIADRLESLHVPFMFLTGYDSWALPDAYRDVTRLSKPFVPQALISMVEALVSCSKDVV